MCHPFPFRWLCVPGYEKNVQHLQLKGHPSVPVIMHFRDIVLKPANIWNITCIIVYSLCEHICVGTVKLEL